MNTLATRIKTLFDEKSTETGRAVSLLIGDLAKLCKIQPPSIYNWMDGKTKRLAGMNLIIAAQFFDASPEWINSGMGSKNSSSPLGINQDAATYSVQNIKTARPQNRPVPVISLIRAGAMKDIGELPYPGEGEVWESPDYKLGPRGWAHIVEGDSMDDGTSKGIPEGYLLFVDPDIAPQAGSFVIAKDVTTQSATFKKLIVDGGRWYLKPLNRQYQAIEIDSPALRVIGVVTEVRAPSRRLI